MVEQATSVNDVGNVDGADLAVIIVYFVAIMLVGVWVCWAVLNLFKSLTYFFEYYFLNNTLSLLSKHATKIFVLFFIKDNLGFYFFLDRPILNFS